MGSAASRPCRASGRRPAQSTGTARWPRLRREERHEHQRACRYVRGRRAGDGGLEARGVPAVAIGTGPFVAEAEEQARVLAMPDPQLVTVPHPIQPTPLAQVQGYAPAALAGAVRRLTSR